MNDLEDYLWLESVDSERALEWSTERSKESLSTLRKSPFYADLEDELTEVLFSSQQMPSPLCISAGWVYNLLRDTSYPNGLLRRCTISDYRNPNPKWHTSIDFLALSKEEGKTWNYRSLQICNGYPDCALVYLSLAGSDHVEIREFDLSNNTFLKDGFFIPLGKSSACWVNKDQILFSTTGNNLPKTKAGAPAEVRSIKRGQLFAESNLILSCGAQDSGVYVDSLHDGDRVIPIIYRSLNYLSVEYYLYRDQGIISRLNIPNTSEVYGVGNGQLLFGLREPLTIEGESFAVGSLLRVPLDEALTKNISPNTVFANTSNNFLESVFVTRTRAWAISLENVSSKLYAFDFSSFKIEPVLLPETKVINLLACDYENDRVYCSIESLNQSPRLMEIGQEVATLHKGVSFFAEDQTELSQYWAKSSDGTRVPYWLFRGKKTPSDKGLPTILYGYGGFLNSVMPTYNPSIGKSWVSSGGVYVIANIRGGSEFGPQWHQSALKEKRQSAYNDFIAVAEDLIERKITTPQQLGLWGGSNGGLLVGVMATQRPDLFKAIYSEVPLLDMHRYHLLHAGASWMAEYGNPDHAEDWEYLKKYSPFHNLKSEVSYPKCFFFTSTHDDRVHPSHARKMAAKMIDMNQDVLFYENREGGHSRTANLEQSLRLHTMRLCFFKDSLT